MASSSTTGWLCGTCRKMKSPSAWYCDTCGQSWESCSAPTANQRGFTTQQWGNSSWSASSGTSRPKSPRKKPRARSRKKNEKWGSSRTLRRTWNASATMAPSSNMATGTTCTRLQRYREGVHCNSDANGPATTTTASYAAQPSCAFWTSLDALPHACPATNANHVSNARHHNARSAAPAPGTAAHGDRGTPDWHESATEAEQNSEGCQEGGEPFTGVPEPRPCRDEKGQQGVFTQPAHSGHCLGQGQRGTAGDGECKTTTMVSMASVPTTVSDQVERVHGTVPSCRASFPSFKPWNHN